MSGNGFEQVPHIQHAGPPVDHYHLSDGIHGPSKHTPATKRATEGSTGAGTRGQTEGGGSTTKPTGGSGGSTEGGGGGGTTEGGGSGPKSNRQFAPTAQRHEFHPPSYKAEQTTVIIPGTPAKTDVYTTTTSQSVSTTSSERTNSVSHTHIGYIQSSQSIDHILKHVPAHTKNHESHEVTPVHHHHHTGEHHPIHHHHVHHGLPHPHPTEHKHHIHHTHHHIHHPVEHPVDTTNHPHKEVTHIHPSQVVTHDRTTSSMVIVPKVTKRDAQIVQEQSTTIHTESVRQKVDQKTVTSDSTIVVTTPATQPTNVAGPVKEHFQPTNTVQVEGNNQGTNSLTLSRTLNSRDALSARVDFAGTKFGNLSIVDDHALFRTTKQDGEPTNSNFYLQGGFSTGKQSTTEGLLPMDKAKLSPILGLNGFTSLGHDRQLYGGLNWSPGEGFADAGIQQNFKSGYLYGGLQYSTLKGFSSTHSLELGGSLNLGHGKSSPSLFVEGTVPFDRNSNQKPTVWTGLRISF